MRGGLTHHTEHVFDVKADFASARAEPLL